MNYVGLLMLGVFVGTLLCIAVRQTTNWSNSVKVVVGLLGAALSGVVFTFIEKMSGGSLGDSLFMYPVGLAWSTLWLYVDQAIPNVKSSDMNLKAVGWLHIAGIILATVLVLMLLLSEDFRSLLPNDTQQAVQPDRA